MLSTEERSLILTSIRADHGFMQEFIDDFLNDIPQDVEKLSRAISERDAGMTESVAHGLKSVIGLFRAMTAYEIVRDIELLGKQSEFSAARVKYEELVLVIEDLKSLLASLKG